MSTETDDPVRGFVRKMHFLAICAGTIIGLSLVFVWSRSIGFGFLAGTAASVVNFQLMAVDAYELHGKNPRISRRFIIGRYVIRYMILFVFLTIVATKTWFNIYATFAGLFLVHVMFIMGRIFQTSVLALKTSRE